MSLACIKKSFSLHTLVKSKAVNKSILFPGIKTHGQKVTKVLLNPMQQQCSGQVNVVPKIELTIMDSLLDFLWVLDTTEEIFLLILGVNIFKQV